MRVWAPRLCSDMRRGEQCTGVCGPPARPITAFTQEKHVREALPAEVLTSGEFCQNSRFRKAAESWAAAQEHWWRESLQGGKVLESSSTSPLAVPSCWGSWRSWAAWAGCLGDSTGALHTETQLVEQTRRWVWSKKEKRRDILQNPSWPEHSIQNSSIILHSHLIFLHDAILQLSRE